jgi:AraC family transcriptional regulator of adaptative response/methylated-DNA-[protein]-cysteine methyltransferase
LVLGAESGRGLCAVLLGDEREALVQELQGRFPGAKLREGDSSLVARVIAWVEAPSPGLEVPLDLRGTEFQQQVWQALQGIPSGATASYAEIAARIERPGSVRAVAQACAANPVALVVPCHRVVRSDGVLSGYRWGVERKRALLEREGATGVRR